MNSLLKVSLILIVILVALSSYLRLAHSGIGCPDWPACYGRIGEPVAAGETLDPEKVFHQNAAQNPAMTWATPMHRLVASVLGLLILFLTLLALRARQDRILSVALLGVTVFLAILGIKSGSLHSIAVVIGNLLGGFCMLGLAGWMLFKRDTPAGENKHDMTLTYAGLVAVTLLSIQIILGGLTSANFAAIACQTLPDCHGSWLPEPSALGTAIDLTRDHQVNNQGVAIGGNERTAIHQTHRIGAVLTLFAVLTIGLLALRAGGGFRNLAIIILFLALLEVLVGIASVLTGLPIALAVAHNWLAALLMLSLLKLLAMNRSQ